MLSSACTPTTTTVSRIDETGNRPPVGKCCAWLQGVRSTSGLNIGYRPASLFPFHFLLQNTACALRQTQTTDAAHFWFQYPAWTQLSASLQEQNGPFGGWSTSRLSLGGCRHYSYACIASWISGLISHLDLNVAVLQLLMKKKQIKKRKNSSRSQQHRL